MGNLALTGSPEAASTLSRLAASCGRTSFLYFMRLFLLSTCDFFCVSASGSFISSMPSLGDSAMPQKAATFAMAGPGSLTSSW